MQAWSVDQFSAGFAKAGNLGNAVDAIKWGADYLVNAHSAPYQFVAVVGNSTLDFNYYGGSLLLLQLETATIGTGVQLVFFSLGSFTFQDVVGIAPAQSSYCSRELPISS